MLFEAFWALTHRLTLIHPEFQQSVGFLSQFLYAQRPFLNVL